MSLYDLKLFTQQNPETDFDTLRPYLRYLVAKGTPGEAAALAEYEQLANSGAVNPRWNEGTGKQAWQLAHPGEAPTPAWLILQELTAEAEKPAVPPTAPPPPQPPTVPTLPPSGPPGPVLPPKVKDTLLPTPGQQPPTAPDIFAFFTKQIGLADSIAVLETVRDGLKRAHEIGQISDLEFGQLSLTYANRHDALSVSTKQPETPQDLVPKWNVGDRVNTPAGPATIKAVFAGSGSRLTRYELTMDSGGVESSEEADLSPFTGGLTGGGDGKEGRTPAPTSRFKVGDQITVSGKRGIIEKVIPGGQYNIRMDDGGETSAFEQDISPFNLPSWGQTAEENPVAAFMRRYALPGFGRNPAQQAQFNQFNPEYATYLAQNALSPAPFDIAPGEGAPGWQDFLNRRQGEGSPAILTTSQQAASLFQQAMGGNPEQQGGFREVMSKQLDDFVGAMLQQYYGGEVARRMQPRVAGLEQQYIGQEQGQGGQFLQFLAEKLGLGQLLKR